jgi:HEPN domain-containing protein
MGKPSSADARLFYRCAIRRFEEAQVLFKAEYTTGAVYLAGYGVECILKVLLLTVVPAKQRGAVLQSFRGAKAHEYDWLRSQYLEKGGARFPREINKHFTLVNDWSTDLRYLPRQVGMADAESFLKATEAILQWAQERI